MYYETIIIKALNCLIKNDSFLIENNLHEACITHKLAEYLQNLIPEFNVDCEYNRNIDTNKNQNDPKTMNHDDIETLKDKILKVLKEKNENDEIIENLKQSKIINDESNDSMILFTDNKTKKVRPDI